MKSLAFIIALWLPCSPVLAGHWVLPDGTQTFCIRGPVVRPSIAIGDHWECRDVARVELLEGDKPVEFAFVRCEGGGPKLSLVRVRDLIRAYDEDTPKPFRHPLSLGSSQN